MKYKLIIIALAVVLMLSACATPKQNDNSTFTNTQNENLGFDDQETNNVAEEIHYNLLSADWPVYKSAKELTDAGNIVVLGEITDISFEILDRMTAKPPTVDSEAENCYLNTIYCIDVIDSYKGVSAKTINVRMLGGLEGIFIEEQIKALGDRSNEGIPVMDGRPNLEIGQIYMFILYQYEDTMPTLVNVQQGAYSIDNPLAKDEYSYVSLKEIISVFGDDSWSAFESFKNTID